MCECGKKNLEKRKISLEMIAYLVLTHEVSRLGCTISVSLTSIREPRMQLKSKGRSVRQRYRQTDRHTHTHTHTDTHTQTRTHARMHTRMCTYRKSVRYRQTDTDRTKGYESKAQTRCMPHGVLCMRFVWSMRAVTWPRICEYRLSGYM